MKKLLIAFITLATTLGALPTATSATPVIRVVDVPHRNFDGSFRNNELVTALAPDGRLGKTLFRTNRPATWVIDAHLVDEVLDMADGYTYQGEDDPVGASIAQIWLQQLRVATVGNPIVALPYGNPDASLARKIAPKEYNYYLELGAQKLESFFGRPVISQNGWSSGKSRLSREFQGIYRDNRAMVDGLRRLINSEEIENVRQRLGVVLNPLLDKNDRNHFIYSSRKAVSQLSEKLRVVSGRYQLTSSTTKVPLTLVNKFDTSTTLNLSLIPNNSRIIVKNIYDITLPPNSQIQIVVPFDVIASGSSVVSAQFMTARGTLVGTESKLNLTLTVIDSRVAWFTTGAAILLFIGAVTQSFRRIRRSRREK